MTQRSRFMATILGLTRRNILKRIAALLAMIMITEAVATPLSQAAMLAQPALDAAVGAKISNPNIGARPSDVAEFVAPFKIPASVGATVEIHAPVSAGRLIYHLQDVHGVVSAQTNLSEMVSRLEAYAAEQKKSLIVAVEGAAGTIDTDSLSSFENPAIKQVVSSALLRNGFLLGEEHAAINVAPGRVKIVGVETPSLYNKNIIAREQSAQARERILVTVREIKGQLNRLKEHNFNALLNTLEKNRLAVEDGRMSMSDYLVFLSRTSPQLTTKYAMVSRMLALNAQEKELDFADVEKEGRLLVQESINKKNDKEVEKMMKEATALREGRLSPLAYYNGLLADADRMYPSLKAYVAYLRNSESVNPDTLFLEVQDLEVDIAKDLVRHPLAYELYKNIRWVERQERFFSLNMVPQEWALQRNVNVEEIFRAHAEIRDFVAEQVGDLGYRFATPPFSVNDLRVAVRGSGDFYRAAEARDTEMVANLNKILKKYQKDNVVVAFIAGGFHTPGVTRQLREKGLAYQVIRPQLETEVVLNKDISYPDYKSDVKLLAERANTDFLRPASNLPNGGTEAVLATMRTGGRTAPRISLGHAIFAPNLSLAQRLGVVRVPKIGNQLNMGIDPTMVVGVLGMLSAFAAIILAYVFWHKPLEAFIRSFLPGGSRTRSKQTATDVALTRANSGVDLSKPNDSGMAIGKIDLDVPTFLRTFVPGPASGGSAGGSGGVIARLSSQNLLSIDKHMQVETIAAAANLALVYVDDADGSHGIVRTGNALLVPERFVRNDKPDVLAPTDENGFTAYDRAQVAAIREDARQAAAAGQTAAQLHNDQMDAQYTSRLNAALDNPDNQRRFEAEYPQIIAEEVAERGTAAEGTPSIRSLAAKWYAESNALRGRDVSNAADVTTPELERANRATNNLTKLIELLSAAPDSLYGQTQPAQTPKSYEELGAEDAALSPTAIAESEAERDILLYYGLLPLRIFAGGSWSRGGLNVPAALVTSAQLAAAGSINLDEFPGLLSDLQQVARPIIDRRLEVERAAARLGLPADAGLANQRIEIGVSDSNSSTIDQFFADAEFLGFPALTFRFFEQRTGKGFGFNDGNIVKQDDAALAGPVTDVPYGHLELEITHNKPNSYYVLDNNGSRHQGGASLNRVLASNGQVLLHHQISLLHPWRNGWSMRPERIQYILERFFRGNQEYVAELADNSASGQKGGLLPVPVGGQLSPEVKAYAGIPADDNHPRTTVFFEGNQLKAKFGAGFIKDRAGVWVNSAVTVAKPAALERVASLDRAPLVMTVRANKVKRDVDGKTVEFQWGAAAYPDGASYGMVFNNTRADVVAPSPAVRSDGVSDASRYEVKQPNEFRQALETAARRDNEADFRAIAAQVVETTQANRARRPTQPISPVVPVVIGAFLYAALYLSFGIAPLGIDAASGYVSLVLGIAATLVAGFGIISAVVARSSVDVSEGTTLAQIQSDPRFSASRVQAVADLAIAAKRTEADVVNVLLRPGILAEVDPVTRTLYVGTGLLKASAGLTGLIRNIVLHVALRHEIVHLGRLQFPVTNAAYRFLNEVIAYVLGTIAVFIPGVFLFGIAGAAVHADAPFLNPERQFAQLGEATQRFVTGLLKIFTNDGHRPTSTEVPNYVAIDADSLDLGAIDDQQTQGFVGLVAGLHAKVKDQLKPGAQVVFYSASGDAAAVSRIERLVRLSNQQVEGVTYLFSAVRAPVTDVRALFGAAVQKNLTDQNTVILSRENAGFTGARFIPIQGIPHLALATFAFSHYQDGEQVLDALVTLFETLTPLRRSGSLTNDIMTEIMAKLSA